MASALLMLDIVAGDSDDEPRVNDCLLSAMHREYVSCPPNCLLSSSKTRRLRTRSKQVRWGGKADAMLLILCPRPRGNSTEDVAKEVNHSSSRDNGCRGMGMGMGGNDGRWC